MKTQQAAEREEQQRIKNLVLNYDLRDGEDQDGEDILAPIPLNTNIHNSNAGLDKAAATNYTRPDKSSNNRSGQRARKLQLSDVDWYAPKTRVSLVENASLSLEKAGFSATVVMRPGSACPVLTGSLQAGASLGSTNGQARVPRHPTPPKAPGGRLTQKEMRASHAALKASLSENMK
jgi:regulator of nonsense transcripts 2